MKTYKSLLVAGIVLGAMTAVVTAATGTYLDFGARYHQEHSVFTGLPYEDGDITYGVAYDIHEDNMMLQLACGFTPENDLLDYGITPEANLLLKDRLLHGGVGVLATYMSPAQGDAEWTDVYYQFVLGLNIPVSGRMSVIANAYYVFETWDDIGEFDADDLEFGGYLSFKF